MKECPICDGDMTEIAPLETGSRQFKCDDCDCEVTAGTSMPPPGSVPFTVIGLNGETRFAETYLARTPIEAELVACEDHPDLEVCGVLAGTHEPVA